MSKVRYYKHNEVGRDFIVGDLHGCYDEFRILLKHIKFDYKIDRMFSVGDLIDRGPKSKDCLELIYAPWFHPVLANHEDMMINSFDDEKWAVNWIYNGGNWYHSEDQKEIKLMAKDAKNIMPHVIVIGANTDKRINIVHAELYKANDDDFVDDLDIDTWNFNEYNENDMIWGRHIAEARPLFDDNSKYSNYGLSTTYCGHTPVDFPIETFNHRYIDTAACYWYRQQYQKSALTVCNLQTDDIYMYHLATEKITETNWNNFK